MCLIAVKDNPKASFSVADFRASWFKNSDGTGIMYVDNGRIVVEKCLSKTFKEHLELYYKHMHRPQFIVHHRMATHGEKSEDNIHPFKVLSIDDGDPYDLYFAHNGIIPMTRFTNDADKKLSDTNLFALQYLQPLMKKYPDIIEQKVFQVMLHDFIGYNKLAFLRSDGRTFIFNRTAGEEHNGCWLSNKHSIAGAEHNHNHWGKNHGANTYSCYGDEHNYPDITAYTEDEDGLYWKNTWQQANGAKVKAENSLTTLNVNEIFDYIKHYAGLPEKQLEDLFISDPRLVYDMINLLTTGKEVNEDELLKEKSSIVAIRLFDLLQSYTKRIAA